MKKYQEFFKMSSYNAKKNLLVEQHNKLITCSLEIF